MNFPSEYSTLSLASEVPVDSFDVITVMDGPGVNGLERYWLGYFDEDLHDDGGSLLARPVGHHLLPHPMSLPEIEEWALENLSIPKEALVTCEANFGRSQRTSEA
ncbi:hypothetical protein [Halosimplex halobium]|uniref:hypothetical protein n=1 Tax=Halosimplex halobium TaxID=3396618 RepID=UPI003F55BFAE